MTARNIRLGLQENWRQFTLLVVINAFVGAMIGLERTVVPLIAEADFGLVSRTVVLSFLVSFGVVKGLANLFAGRMSDRLGRKKILVAGWLFGLPVPFLIIFARNLSWVVFANVLLGINHGLCWSTTVIMKIDLVGPRQRGLSMGLNEFAGYVAVSLSALLTGYLAAAYGLRPAPFFPGIAFAFLGLLLSAFFAVETRGYARQEASARPVQANPTPAEAFNSPSFAQILLITSWKDRALFSVSQAGMVNNLNDGMVWGLAPIFLAGALSDRWGRKWMIVTGMWIQAVGIGLFVGGKSFSLWLAGSALLGIGTALVYPTLLAAVSDVAHPEWRASALGVYRLWRDGGYAVGALLSGLLADLLGIPAAMMVIAGLTFLSGSAVAAVMYETLPAKRKGRVKAGALAE